MGTKFEKRAFYITKITIYKIRNDEILQFLLNFNFNLLINVVFIAIVAKLIENVKILIEIKIDFNKIDNYDNFFLHVAIYY